MNIAVDARFRTRDAFRATMAQSPPRRVARRTAMWPVVLCGFVAIVCATASFLESPLARHPAVAPYVDAALARL